MAQMQTRMALAAIVALVIACPAIADPPRRYAVDGANSSVSARVAFMGLASKTAHFPEVSGGVVLDPQRPSAIDLDVTLNARALRASDSTTLARLRGPSFFDVERYPQVRFAGHAMKMTGPRTADVSGELTARGVTRREVLHVTFASEPGALNNREPMSFAGTMQIDRRSYGMTAYSMIVGNRVTITIRARMNPV